MQLTSNSDKITRDYFDSLLIETRYMDAELPSTEMTLFGEVFRTPIMTAALSHLHNSARNGMTIYARAAALSGAVHWVGMGSDQELEDIVATSWRTSWPLGPVPSRSSSRMLITARCSAKSTMRLRWAVWLWEWISIMPSIPKAGTIMCSDSP